MKRVDASGFAPGNLFTDGDPQSAILATLIEETWLNTVQEEIAGIVEFAGLVLDQTGAVTTQLRQAVEIIALGGSGLTNIEKVIANNQAGTSLGAEFLFNKANHVSAFMEYRIHRETDDPLQLDEVGKIKVNYRPVQDDWTIFVSRDTEDDLSGVTFLISAAGQVSYDSTNMPGAAYVGELKIPRILRINA